jgi:uncharacterized protein YwqG
VNLSNTVAPDWSDFAIFIAAALLLIAFPKQVLRSLLRWGRNSTHEPTSPRGVHISADLVVKTMRAMLAPTLLLTPTSAMVFSKLGGTPDLPTDAAWPRGHRRPRLFLAQIDFSEVPADAIDWLPRKGRVYAFYDPDALGCADVVQIMMHGRAPSGEWAERPSATRRHFRERRVSFTCLTSAPSLDWLGMDSTDVLADESEFEALWSIADAPPPDEMQHRIGGYPNEIQPARMAFVCEHLSRGLPEPRWDEQIGPGVEKASKDWRLLLQIDSDPKLKMNFGDGGRLYVFIREADARAADFSKTVTIFQTY